MVNQVSAKQLKETVSKFLFENGINEEIASELPNTWEKYGDLILFPGNSFTSDLWFEKDITLWNFIAKMLNCKRIGLKGRIKNDDFRTPKVNLVYGPPGDACFTDNGIKYSWDIEHCMFCRGNLSERHRIAQLNCTNEVIVDLFAGIGYFTLPYLVKANAKFVHACEWNPYSIASLRQNLENNGVFEKCCIYEGDNRKFAPKNVGHRINVGLIPNSEGFWRTACESLISSGGVIYIHQNVSSNITCSNQNENVPCSDCANLLNYRKGIDSVGAFSVISSFPFLNYLKETVLTWKKNEWFEYSLHVSHSLLSYLEEIYQCRWNVAIKEYFRVKSYAPHIDHIVYGAYCYPIE